MATSPVLHLPRSWPKTLQAGFLHAVALVRKAMLEAVHETPAASKGTGAHLAEHFARAGLVLAASTVRRMLRREQKTGAPSPSQHHTKSLPPTGDKKPRVVTARSPHRL